MEHPGFFEKAGPFTLSDIAGLADAEVGNPDKAALEISDVCPLDLAGAGDITFLDNPKYLGELENTRAAACFIAPKHAERLPQTTIPLTAKMPYQSFAKALAAFYPDALRSKGADYAADDFAGNVHPTAGLEDNVVIEPGAVVGREAQIGSGTTIAAGAIIGYRVSVGRNCYIGPGAVITHSLLGNSVVVHSGVCAGQDGFGFAMGPTGHLKVPQIGRVIIQDDVEIGANTTIDRGALKDTIIGEGTKIDNQVQIGHNVVIGRHCVIVAKCGIAGSTEMGDFAVMGAASGLAGHLKMGAGAMLAGGSLSKDDIPPGGRWGGTPARPFTEWARELAAIRRLTRKKPKKD